MTKIEYEYHDYSGLPPVTDKANSNNLDELNRARNIMEHNHEVLSKHLKKVRHERKFALTVSLGTIFITAASLFGPTDPAPKTDPTPFTPINIPQPSATAPKQSWQMPTATRNSFNELSLCFSIVTVFSALRAHRNIRMLKESQEKNAKNREKVIDALKHNT